MVTSILQQVTEIAKAVLMKEIEEGNYTVIPFTERCGWDGTDYTKTDYRTLLCNWSRGRELLAISSNGSRICEIRKDDSGDWVTEDVYSIDKMEAELLHRIIRWSEEWGRPYYTLEEILR